MAQAADMAIDADAGEASPLAPLSALWGSAGFWPAGSSCWRRS